MTEAIETIKKGRFTAEIFQDEMPDSPREWDNIGKMICFHNRYDLGDEHNLKSDDFSGWEEIEDFLIKEKNAVVILPLYLYDHSGITISNKPFSCRWDSGQVGFIYADRETILKEFNRKRLSKSLIKKVKNILEGETETYDQYLTGDVYSYTIIETKPCCKTCGHIGDSVVDSCGGFYGFENVKEEVNSIMEGY